MILSTSIISFTKCLSAWRRQDFNF